MSRAGKVWWATEADHWLFMPLLLEGLGTPLFALLAYLKQMPIGVAEKHRTSAPHSCGGVKIGYRW